MAKPLILSINEENSIFQIKKIERKKLYGYRKRLAVDENNEECKRASLTEDGQVLIKSGMTSQGWFIDGGGQIESNEIGAIDENNNELDLIPSTLGMNQNLEGPVNPKDLLDISVTTSYSIIPDQISEDLEISLEKGEIWKFNFNLRADYRMETSFILKNDNGYFAIVGIPNQVIMLSPSELPPEDEDEDEDDELDFEMF
tara:strand:+ start:1852 stop:2451 length:600 start_codon:yes stop_codon:yes gene_type:complete